MLQILLCEWESEVNLEAFGKGHGILETGSEKCYSFLSFFILELRFQQL